MEEQKQLTQKQLRERAVQFYAHYKNEIEEVTRRLAIHLNQFALAYTLKNKLPKEAVSVTTRIKSLGSFLKKLMRRGYPSFYYPTEIITDLIEGRVTCWFLEDCYGMLNEINSSNKIKARKDTLEDYINQPKKLGIVLYIYLPTFYMMLLLKKIVTAQNLISRILYVKLK